LEYFLKKSRRKYKMLVKRMSVEERAFEESKRREVMKLWSNTILSKTQATGKTGPRNGDVEEKEKIRRMYQE
jgi:hypothetical protein